MSNSPRSMWSGSIELGLLNIPVTVGKAWADEKEQNLVQVCDAHESPEKINRNERCNQCGGPPQKKAYAVDVGDEQYRVFDDEEMNQIEQSTKTLTLKIEDCQPIKSLPMVFSTGCYYIRHDDKSKMAPRAMNRLATALGKTGYGLICHWGNSSSQKLCVISAERGVLILRIVPHLSEIRAPSKKERQHWSMPSDEGETEKVVELLNAFRNPKGFQYRDYHDEGFRLRIEAVERILSGETQEDVPEPDPQFDFEQLEDALDRAIADRKEKQNV